MIFFVKFPDEDEDEDEGIHPLPLRSYVESNEEMTESDCNVQEDDERTGMYTLTIMVCMQINISD